MINQLVVIQSTSGTVGTIQDNGADAFVDNAGRFNVAGAAAIPAASVIDVVKISSATEQVKKQRITCTSANNATYTFVLKGFAMSTGLPTVKTVTWTSSSANTVDLTSAGITATVNAISDFNVTATDITGGVVAFIAKTATPACFNAPLFSIQNADTKIVVSPVLTVSFAAAPAGGRTAQGYPLVSDAGAVTAVIITDGGDGYMTAPAITVSSGAATATCLIFEGEVISTSITGAGAGYVNREGYLVVGTPAALIAKYGNPVITPNTPGAVAYPQLSLLTSGYTYTEWIVSYQLGQPGGITTFAQTVTTGQISILVYESATNVAPLNAVWGTLNNLRKGYGANIITSLGNVAFANTAGALSDVVCITSMATEALKVNDQVGYSLTSYGTVLQPSVILAGTVAITSGIGATIGGNVAAASAKIVKRRPISR